MKDDMWAVANDKGTLADFLEAALLVRRGSITSPRGNHTLPLLVQAAIVRIDVQLFIYSLPAYLRGKKQDNGHRENRTDSP